MSCVYRYIDEWGETVYIGKTDDLDSRHLHHINKSDKNHDVLIDCSLEYIGGLSSADSDILETYFIAKYRPRLNKSKQWGESSVAIRALQPWEPVQFPRKTRLAIDAIQRRRPRCRRCKNPLKAEDHERIEYVRRTKRYPVEWFISLCCGCMASEQMRVTFKCIGDAENLKDLEEEDQNYHWLPPPPEQLWWDYKLYMEPEEGEDWIEEETRLFLLWSMIAK